jgi:RNA polymerase sigma-70 factor (ECF subfamily)
MYEEEFANVYRAVLMLCGDRAVAEEATQEAFARALARWRRLRSHPRPAGWVVTTAMNVARRQLRRRPEVTTAEPTARDADAELDLRAAIADLSERQQQAVVLHYLLDLSVEETASVMSCDAGTVKTHLSRARTALGRTLDHEDGTVRDGEGSR